MMRDDSSSIVGSEWRVILAIAAVAFGIRLAGAMLFPNIAYPDEIFQVLAPAHKLVFGTGVTAWEWVVGIRSWIFPGLVAGLMWLAKEAGATQPGAILLPITVFMIAASLLPVICGYCWGFVLEGRATAIIAGAANALWIDEVYFSSHTMTGVFAVDLLVLALFLGYPGKPEVGGKRLFWSGLLFGLAFVVRFELAPGIALAVVWIACKDLRRRAVPLGAGLAVTVLLGGMIDGLTWTYPFQSIWLNIWLNIFVGVSKNFGTSAPYTLVLWLLSIWGPAILILVPLAAFGARRLPLLAAMAVLTVAVFSVPAHKEYRFIYPAIPLLVTLAALGLAELLLRSAPEGSRWAIAGSPRTMAGALAFWLALSGSPLLLPSYQYFWHRAAGTLAAFRLVSSDSGLCGAALLPDVVVWGTPGQSGLPPNVTLYQPDWAHFARASASFNFVVGHPGGMADGIRRFRLLQCFHNRGGREMCVWRRPGGCMPGNAPLPQVNWPAQLIDRRIGGTTRLGFPGLPSVSEVHKSGSASKGPYE